MGKAHLTVTARVAKFAESFYVQRMETQPNLDVRSIANALLKEAWLRGCVVSNLKLQKLLYLCHAFYVAKNGGASLIRGDFEAWQYGPVHREAYDSFKKAGDKSINTMAMRTNPITLECTEIDLPTDQAVCDVISEVVRAYGSWSAAQLVELTHKKDGPWDYVVKSAASQANMGLKITNDIIRARFKYHWFGEAQHVKGNPNEEEILIA